MLHYSIMFICINGIQAYIPALQKIYKEGIYSWLDTFTSFHP